MRIADIIIRSLLALQLVFSGLNKFAQWMQPEMDGKAAAAFQGLMQATFVMPTVAVVEIVAGLLLITGKLKTLSYVLLLPVVYGILAFHIANDDVANIGGGAMVALLYVALLLLNKDKLKPLFK